MKNILTMEVFFVMMSEVDRKITVTFGAAVGFVVSANKAQALLAPI